MFVNANKVFIDVESMGLIRYTICHIIFIVLYVKMKEPFGIMIFITHNNNAYDINIDKTFKQIYHMV